MNFPTAFSAQQLTDLTNVILDKPVGRAADKDAAIARFLKVATKAGVDAPVTYLTMKFDTARLTLVRVMEEIDRANAGKPPIAATIVPPGAKAPKTPNPDLDIPGFLQRGTPEAEAAATAAFAARSAKLAAAAPKPASLGAAAVAEVERGKRKASKRGEKPAQSKLAMIADMLTSAKGTTTAEILKATGWPAVSVPQQAKAAGLKLRKEKDGKASRYYGTPIKKAAASASDGRRGQVRRGRA